METKPLPNKIGFQYYPDSAHYTNKDLNENLPYLEELQASWLVLRSETSRAIPETFISGLLAKGITPIIHLPLSLPNAPAAADIKAILNAYANWGIRYILLFDQPNQKTSWSVSGWSQSNLVESFLDRFIPLANECIYAGLTPIFPALAPGGDFWDLSFFSLALQGLLRRGQKGLLNKMALAANACTFGHPLDWGKGGSKEWPQNKPYSTPAGSQDQIGFNQYVWLEEIAAKILGKSLPLFLLGLGRKTLSPADIYSPEEHANIIRQIKVFITRDSQPSASDLPLLAGGFWLLRDVAADENNSMAWVKEDKTFLPAFGILAPEKKINSKQVFQAPAGAEKTSQPSPTSDHLISHYLLLPRYDWGVSEWHLDVVKPFILKHQPTVGFSIKEAALAAEVTVVGGEQEFPESALSPLFAAGCKVERISGDGTSIATQLAER